MQTIQSRANKVIAEDVGLTQRRVREAMRVYAARPEKLAAELTIAGKRVPLADFGARETARGVTYRIGRRGRALAPGAFIIARRGREAVLSRRVSGPGTRAKRRGPAKKYPTRSTPIGSWLPLSPEFKGPSLARVASHGHTSVDNITRDAAETILQKNLAHELRFIAERSGG